MADLGVLEVQDVLPPIVARRPVTEYRVVIGRYLGVVLVRSSRPAITARIPASDYVIRQLRVIYRQLWPNHGQRFPQ